MASRPILLDDAQFAHALAVLDREQPSANERRWFLWLHISVWSAVLLTPLWFATVLATPRIQFFFLLLALACYLSVIPVLIANLPFLVKVGRAAIAEWQLGVAKSLGAIRLRPFMIVLLFLMPLGVFMMLLAVSGIRWELERQPREWIALLFSVVLFFFSTASLCLYPMERGKRRLDAAARLRSTLVQSGEADRELPSNAYVSMPMPDAGPNACPWLTMSLLKPQWLTSIDASGRNKPVRPAGLLYTAVASSAIATKAPPIPRLRAPGSEKSNTALSSVFWADPTPGNAPKSTTSDKAAVRTTMPPD